MSAYSFAVTGLLLISKIINPKTQYKITSVDKITYLHQNTHSGNPVYYCGTRLSPLYYRKR